MGKIVLSRKRRLGSLCWAYNYHCIVEQIGEQVSIWHWNWGEFYKLLFLESSFLGWCFDWY